MSRLTLRRLWELPSCHADADGTLDRSLLVRARSAPPRQAKIVRQESQNIDALYDKKRKQAETGQKMCVVVPCLLAGWLGRVRQALADLARPPSPLSARLPSRSAQSTALNTSRLKILRAREQLLADLFETTRKGIKDLGEDEGKYEQLLVKLIVQVRCRPPPLLLSAYVRVPHRRTLD
jgi:V-type H+-transporting ATPase subunit E